MNLKNEMDDDMTNNNRKIMFQNKMQKFIPPKENWTPIDKALFTSENFFRDYQKTTDLTIDATKYSFKHHFENNVIYSIT